MSNPISDPGLTAASADQLLKAAQFARSHPDFAASQLDPVAMAQAEGDLGAALSAPQEEGEGRHWFEVGERVRLTEACKDMPDFGRVGRVLDSDIIDNKRWYEVEWLERGTGKPLRPTRHHPGDQLAPAAPTQPQLSDEDRKMAGELADFLHHNQRVSVGEKHIALLRKLASQPRTDQPSTDDAPSVPDQCSPGQHQGEEEQGEAGKLAAIRDAIGEELRGALSVGEAGMPIIELCNRLNRILDSSQSQQQPEDREPNEDEWYCDSCGLIAPEDSAGWEKTPTDEAGVSVERCPDCRFHQQHGEVENDGDRS